MKSMPLASRPRLATASVGVLLSPAARAADPHGLLTLVVGVPLLLAASAVLAILLLVKPGRLSKSLSTALFAPVMLYSLYVALDAFTLFDGGNTENATIGAAFFALMALCCLLFGLTIRRSSR